jgi:hypothetical protein
MNIVQIDYVDPGVQGEYGPFGKVIATSNVRGLGEEEISEEIRQMTHILGAHIHAVRVEEIPAFGGVIECIQLEEHPAFRDEFDPDDAYEVGDPKRLSF